MTNEVVLQGRLSRQPEAKELPSGDTVWTLRIVVPRRPGDRRGVDWFDCSVWTGRLRRSVAAWSEGDEVEVRGILRRRFFRTGGMPNSLVEVEATGGRLIRRALPA